MFKPCNWTNLVTTPAPSSPLSPPPLRGQYGDQLTHCHPQISALACVQVGSDLMLGILWQERDYFVPTPGTTACTCVSEELIDGIAGVLFGYGI